MSRYKYVGSDPCQLVDGSFAIELEPDQEFDAPDTFVPEPNPHPSFTPIAAKSAPAKAPQE